MKLHVDRWRDSTSTISGHRRLASATLVSVFTPNHFASMLAAMAQVVSAIIGTGNRTATQFRPQLLFDRSKMAVEINVQRAGIVQFYCAKNRFERALNHRCHQTRSDTAFMLKPHSRWDLQAEIVKSRL